ncbi:MAG: hypothetical protein ABI388_01440 [Bacteroidia bacterium]
MKHLTILMLGSVAVLFSQACQPKESKSTQPNSEIAKEIVKEDPNKVVFENLDQILSPFEDMTEFALDKNDEGVIKSLEKVEAATKDGLFEKNLTQGSVKSLIPQIEKLKEFIKQKNHEQIALASADIFEFNTSNFIDTKKIENQIRIEHLDYMGFKTLALLNQRKIDWQKIQQTVSDVQKEWLVLSSNVKDNNLKDSFNYLFEGLLNSTTKKDIKTAQILASMDLSLVDVLETNF